MICVGILLPTQLRDEGGRVGLTIAIGVFLNGKTFKLRSSAVSGFFRIYLQLLNRTFGVSLPDSGANHMLQIIRAAHISEDAEQRSLLGIKLRTLLDGLLLSSDSAGDLLRSRWRWARLRWKRKRRLPKLIIYEADSDYVDLLSLFLNELDGAITRKGKTAVQQPFDNLNQDMTCIRLVPLDRCLSQAAAIKLRKRNRKRYLTIY